MNGDITTAKQAKAALDQSGAAAVMIGRAAIGNPWLLDEVACYLTQNNPTSFSSQHRCEQVKTWYADILDLYGEKLGNRMARKHLAGFVDTEFSEPHLGCEVKLEDIKYYNCLLYTSPSPRDLTTSRMPSSA